MQTIQDQLKNTNDLGSIKTDNKTYIRIIWIQKQKVKLNLNCVQNYLNSMLQPGLHFISHNPSKLSIFNSKKVLSHIILLCAVFSVSLNQTLSITPNPVSRTINANTVYQFTIIDSLLQNNTNTQAFIEISFPPSFFILNTGANYTCSNTSMPSITYPCRATTTNIIQINNPSSPSQVLMLSVSMIKNPSSTEQVTFGYKFRTNNTIISQIDSSPFSSYVPGSLISCSASFSPNTVHTASQITITMTLGNQVQAGGTISVNFPSLWFDSANPTFTPLIATASQTCTRRSTNNTFLSSTLACGTPLFQQFFLANNSISTTAPSGSFLSFSISNILTPPTVNNGNSIVVTTHTQNNKEIDKSSCLISPLTVRSIAGINTKSNFNVGANAEFNFDFLAPTPIIAEDKLIISAVSPNDTFFILSASANVIANSGASALTMVVDSSNPTLVVLNFPNMSNMISASQMVSVILGLSLKPLISSGTKSITLTLRRGGNDYASQIFPLTVLTNSLLNPSISLSTPIVSSNSFYTFIMTTSNILGPRSRVIIRLPPELSISNGACTFLVTALNNPSNINSSLACNAASNQIITLTGVNSNALPAGQRLTITINNIMNSQTTAPSSVFRIQTYFGQTITDPTDLSSTMTVTMTAATIGVVSVTSQVPRVAEDTNYTISYTVKTKFLANSKIRIGIPPEISLGATLLSSFSINYINNTATSFQSCPVTPLSINSVQYLDISGISTTFLPASTIINLRISTLVNPTSLRPSSSFRVIQIDSRGFEVEKLQAGLTVTNNLTNSFSSLYASQDPVRINGQTAIYTLYLKTSIDLAINDYLEINLDSATSKNSQILFSNPVTSCDVSSVLNQRTKLVTNFRRISSTVLIIDLKQTMSSNQIYEIAINTIERARTQQIPNNLTVRSFKYVSASSAFGISEGRISPNQTNTKSTIQSVGMSIITKPSQLFSFQSFTITVVPKIPLINGDYLVIDIPNLYTFLGATLLVTPTSNLSTLFNQSLCVQGEYLCSHYMSDPFKIRVQEYGGTIFSNLSSVTVTIKNSLYRSPSTFSFAGTGYYFKATSYASNNMIMQETVVTGNRSTNLTNAEFYLTCNTDIATYHCMTCTSSGLCTSCYQPITFNSTNYNFDGFKFLTSDSKCLSQCVPGYFIDNSSSLCVKCNSPCKTCQITSTTCLSCIQNITTNKYFPINKTCFSVCPDGFYADPGNTCIKCSATCNTCVTDALTCTSCPSGTFLNSVTKTCVSGTNCPSGTFANSLINTCATCHISCSGCITQSTNCLTCATGYIIDFTNSTFKNCTNLCPPGKVNDTISGLGCRCETQCKTCEGTIGTCKSCETTSIYKYFYGTTCLITCPDGTYASVIQATGNDICVMCTEANCRSCDAENCNQCVGQFALYQGRCFQTCPTASVLHVVNGIRKCESCSVGCMNCDLGVTTCTTCQSGFVRQANSTGTYCATVCSTGTVNFNNTICLSSCPDGYDNVAQVCRLKQNNSTNAEVQSSGLTKTRQVPFPFIIATFIFLVIVLLSKIVLPTSIVSTLFTSIVGALQPFSWIAAVAVSIFEISQGKHWPTTSIGVYLILAALGTNFILNIIGIVFYFKYISKDPKFALMFGYNEKKVFLGKCPTISILVISFIVSHKILQLLFSNFLLSRHFSYKLQNVKKMVPLNYLLFCSIIPSLLAIVGGCIISYELQNYNVESSAFIAALDMILLTVMGIIASLWVTNRKSEDYEKDITDTNNQKHYTEQIFVEGHVEEATQQFNQVFMEQSGIRRQGNAAKNYYYQASKVQKGQHTHDNDPLSKRQTVQNPISKSNHKKIRGSNLSDEQSSQALVINEKKKRRNLKDQFSSDDDRNNIDQDGMEVIDLEKTKQNFNKDDDSKDMPLISKIKLSSKHAKKKPEELVNMSSQQKKMLKQKIQSQLDPQEKEKLSILSKQKELKIKKNKQKIQQILKLQKAEKQKLAADQRAKVEKVQEAVDLLKRKQIKIEEYLLYSEIIKEQSGQYDNDQEQQISEIDQKTNTIIKGILEEDQQLEEVINLSPKRKILQSQSIVFMNKSKEKQKQTTPSKRQGQLQRSKSRESNSVPKSNDKKQTSKEKTIKKQPITTNKKPGKNQKKNKNKPPKDLQVNYNDENGNQKAEKSPDSQEEPELPKNRSSIIGNNDRSQNKSQKRLNPKKGIFNRDDIMMIDVGSNRKNLTENQASQFGGMEEEHSDMMPPNHLRSTEKVEYKKNHPFDGLRNAYDSELDRQTLKSVENPDIDFFNEISPSKFGVQNKQFDNVETEDLPMKPKIIQQINYDQDITIERKGKSPKKNDGFEIYEGQELDDQSNYISKANMNNTMNRSSSDMRDFKSVILRKTMQNEKLKQLEKIYVPKPEKKFKSRRNNSVSRISSRKD